MFDYGFEIKIWHHLIGTLTQSQWHYFLCFISCSYMTPLVSAVEPPLIINF